MTIPPALKPLFDPDDFCSALAPDTRLMGLDHGPRHIGLALSDMGRTLATPCDVIPSKKLHLVISRLQALIDAEKVGGLVIGMPYHMDGTAGPRAQSVRAFQRNLAASLSLPMLFWDERLSTSTAKELPSAEALMHAKKARALDARAAQIILQDFLFFETSA
jgi:putative Holliday junction resolvase